MLAGDPVVRMRAADAAEKLTAGDPGLLAPYKRRLLREVAASDQQEVRWHVAQMIPRLTLTTTERAAAVETLIAYLDDTSSIVKTFSMQALADLAENDAALTARILPLVEDLTARGSAAVKSRGRKLLPLLRGYAVPTQPGQATDRAGSGARRGGGARNDDALLIPRLQRALDGLATASARRFWEKYLKGAASFRGVPMAGVRRAAHAWWRGEGLSNRPFREQKQIALRLFDEPQTEDRLAGVLIFSEILLPRLTAADLPSFALLFERGRIADWNLCDWFCVKVLGRMVERADDPAKVAKAISAWRTARTLWQRRASCVAFVNLAKGGERLVPGLPAMIVENCAALVRNPARFAQTGVGWVMRELSRYDAVLASRFAAEHSAELSPEAMKYIAAKMPAAEQRRLRALHAQSSAQRRR
jgi:3-methyladenine DNA glycosylase AlkD